jgi:NTE family protein
VIRLADRAMITAFVLSGGGSLGAVQVGMMQALTERGIVADLLVGTSAGAINAAYLAGHGTDLQSLDGLAASWLAARRGEIFPLEPRHQMLALAGRRSSLFSDRGIRRLISTNLDYRRLEDALIPIHVVATDLLSGVEVVLSHGDAVSAVLASTAIPGVFPAVQRDGLILVDGGLADNTAISVAVDLGCDRIYVLPTGFACASTQAPPTPQAIALHALGFLTQQRLIVDIARFGSVVDLRVLPPLCPLAVPSTDFRHASELIDRARSSAGQWLDSREVNRPHPERVLASHRHHQPASRLPETPFAASVDGCGAPSPLLAPHHRQP